MSSILNDIFPIFWTLLWHYWHLKYIFKTLYPCREYLAVFKKTVQVHEVFLQRLSSHPSFRKDRNFQIFLEYDQDVSLPFCLDQSYFSQTRKQRDSERDCWHCLFPAKLQCWQFIHKWRERVEDKCRRYWGRRWEDITLRATSCLVQRKNGLWLDNCFLLIHIYIYFIYLYIEKNIFKLKP